MTQAVEFDPNDPIQHIGEALGLIVVALAQEHDAPHALLAAMQRAVQQCNDHPAMYAPQTKALVHYAAQSLHGALEAAASNHRPN
jgi:hypothetical protein